MNGEVKKRIRSAGLVERDVRPAIKTCRMSPLNKYTPSIKLRLGKLEHLVAHDLPTKGTSEQRLQAYFYCLEKAVRELLVALANHPEIAPLIDAEDKKFRGSPPPKS